MTKRLALCVGLNYPGTNAALSGCVNDAMDWHEVALNKGYSSSIILEPTKSQLVAELRGLVARAGFGTRVLFTFSGHGTWVPDRDGDEDDGRDEALCLADYASGGLLTDDELFSIIGSRRHGVRWTTLSDSCHSGTVARSITMPMPKASRRFVSPADIEVVPVDRERAVALEKQAAHKPSRSGAILISGCADPEYSYDASFAGRPNGAFTRAALDTLPHAKNIGGWHKAIRERLPSERYPQSPQLTASTYQKRLSPL